MRFNFFGAFCMVIAMLFPVFGQSIALDTGNFFRIDPSTPHCLGFRLYVQGDQNATGTCTVQYKQNSSATWLTGYPMLRVHKDTCDRNGTGFVTGNMFAGSVLNLTPSTLYDVKFHMNDAVDGGATFDTTLSVYTSGYPAAFATGKQTFHVYPPGYGGTKLTPTYDSLSQAVAAATPGTIILVHPGVYTGFFVASKNAGTPTDPIVIRGAKSEGIAYLDGIADAGTIFSISLSKYIWIEDLTMRNCYAGVNCTGSEGTVVRNCDMFNVCWGIVSRGSPSRGCFFINNRITGKVVWYPRVAQKEDYTGIVAFGKGMVICYNTISKFWDCYETTGNAPAMRDVYNPTAVCVDVYNNFMTEANDDCIEIDYSYSNIRVWNNLLMNTHTGLSTQPFYGGPAYMHHNVVFNATQTGLKLHNNPSGVLLFNNTIGAPFISNIEPVNLHLRNNVFLGYNTALANYIMEAGTIDPRTTLDYDGWLNYSPTTSGYVLKWTGPNNSIFRCTSASDLYTQSGKYEQHGQMIQYANFMKMFNATPGTVYTRDSVDFRISSATAAPVDKGQVLANITDGYKGAAPDLGAIEYGDTLPYVGWYPAGFPYTPVSVRNNNVAGGNAQGALMQPGILLENMAARLAPLGNKLFTLEVYNVKGERVLSMNTTRAALASSFKKSARLSNGMYVIKAHNREQRIVSTVLCFK